MNNVNRRTVLGSILPGALLGVLLPGRAKAAPVAKAAPADQPHMQAALDALKTADHELDIADADKGGHRAKAIPLVRSAIEEVRKGIEYFRTH